MQVPDDLRYTPDHEWLRVEGDEAVIGITAYAAEQLGDVVFVELPATGTALDAAQAFGVIESVKTASDLYAPAAGEVVAINDALGDKPELVNDDPYGDGWMVAHPPDRSGLSGRGRRAADGRRRVPQDRGGWLTPSPSNRPSRLRALYRMTYGPHTPADREQMLGALGIDSIDALFADIPAAVRAGGLDLPRRT